MKSNGKSERSPKVCESGIHHIARESKFRLKLQVSQTSWARFKKKKEKRKDKKTKGSTLFDFLG